MKLLFLDFSSETNIGDIALQEGLVALTRRHFPDAKLAATVIFGANQEYKVGNHFSALFNHRDIQVEGALRPTFYPLGNGVRNIYVAEALNVLGLLAGLLVVLGLMLNRSVTKGLLPKSFRRTISLIEESDLILWKGKNFRGRNSLFFEVYRVLIRLFMPLVCLALGKKIACISASIWPLNFSLTRRMLRAVLRRCIHVSVRESKSLEEANKLLAGVPGAPQVHLFPDLSFALLRDMQKKPPTSESKPRTVAFTIVDWSEDGAEIRARYKNSISALMDDLADTYSASIQIVPQVIKEWESAEGIVSEILNTVKPSTRERITTPKPAHSVESMVEIYRGVDYLVATRMHSAIFALSIGTPVLAVPYDAGAKWNILEDIGCKPYMLPYQTVTTPLLLQTFQQLMTQREQYIRHTQSEIQNLFTQVDLCITSLVTELNYREKQASV